MAGSVIGALRVNLGLDSAQFIKGTKNAEGAMKGMSLKMAAAGAAIGAALGAATAAFVNLARNSINTADEISKSAIKIGIATEELSRLRYAADLSGVSFEQLEKGLLILNRNMAGIGGESQKVSAAFAQMGIETRNADGTLKSSTQVLKEMADVFAGMPDGAEKSALAMATLGKSGADMIPLINGGSAALQQLTDEADQFGIVIDAETGLKAEAFNDNLTRLQGVFGALATQIAAEMLPALVELTDFLVRNAGQVRESTKGVMDFFRGLQVLGGYVSTIANEFNQRFGPAIEWARQRLAGLYQVATAILNPLSFAIDKIRLLGASGGGSGAFGGAVGTMMQMGESALRNAQALKAVGGAAIGAAPAIASAGGAARGAGSAFRDMNRDADDSARKLQSLVDRLNPAAAKARKLREELALVEGGKLSEGEKDRLRFQLGTEGLGEASVSKGLLDTGPLIDAREEYKKTLDELAEQSKRQTVTIGDSFATMADRVVNSLQSLSNGIRGGGFLDILGGVMGLFTQLGGLGVFGKGIQTNINKPIGGARAMGGPVSMGKQYLVGENGPEMFAPGRSGTIIPNHAMGRTHVTVGIDPANGNITAFVNGQIAATAPAIAGAGAAMAQGQMAQRAQRRIR